eukprot:476051-Prorocentrum_minimum.AAC.2
MPFERASWGFFPTQEPQPLLYFAYRAHLRGTNRRGGGRTSPPRHRARSARRSPRAVDVAPGRMIRRRPQARLRPRSRSPTAWPPGKERKGK